MLWTGEAWNEITHHLVPHEAVDQRAVGDEGIHPRLIKAVHHVMERLRSEALPELRRATYVCEQERHRNLGSALVPDQMTKTAGAIAGVPREAMLAEKPQEGPERGAEGRGA